MLEEQQLDVDTSHLSIYLSAPSLEEALSFEQAHSLEEEAPSPEEPLSSEETPSLETDAEEPSAAASASAEGRWLSPEPAAITLETSLQQLPQKRQRTPSSHYASDSSEYNGGGSSSSSRKKAAKKKKSSSSSSAAQPAIDDADAGNKPAAGASGPTASRMQGSRFRFNPDQNTIMRQWLMSHIDEPYPDNLDKEELAEACGITVKQVSVWFLNWRQRNKRTKCMPPNSGAAAAAAPAATAKPSKKVKDPRAPQDKKDIKGVVVDDSNPYAVPRYPL